MIVHSKYALFSIFLLSLTYHPAVAAEDSMLWRSCTEVEGKGAAYCTDAELERPLTYYLHPTEWPEDDPLSNQFHGLIRSRSMLKPQIKEINTYGRVHILQVNYFLADKNDLVRNQIIDDANKTLANKDASEENKWSANNYLEHTKIYSDEGTQVLVFWASVVLAEKGSGQFVPLMRWDPTEGEQVDPQLFSWGNQTALVFLSGGQGQNAHGMSDTLGWLLDSNKAVFMDSVSMAKIDSVVVQKTASVNRELGPQH